MHTRRGMLKAREGCLGSLGATWVLLVSGLGVGVSGGVGVALALALMPSLAGCVGILGRFLFFHFFFAGRTDRVCLARVLDGACPWQIRPGVPGNRCVLRSGAAHCGPTGTGV